MQVVLRHNLTSRSCVIALAAMVAGLSLTAQAAEPATSTLACKGTVTDLRTPNAKPEPLSMGIIVNFTDRKILGLGGPGSGTVVDIMFMDDVTLNFSGSDDDNRFRTWSIIGSIDRLTGDLEATSTTKSETKKIMSSDGISLKCRPTQRMF